MMTVRDFCNACFSPIVFYEVLTDEKGDHIKEYPVWEDTFCHHAQSYPVRGNWRVYSFVALRGGGGDARSYIRAEIIPPEDEMNAQND